MRYAICLAQDVLLLIVLLRMTYLGLHAQRRLMFLFLCAWFVACVAGLFCAQVMDIASPRYAAIFFSCSAAAWVCGIPEVSRASFALARSAWQAAAVAGVLLMAIAACYFAVRNSAMRGLARDLALNYWIAMVFGATFTLAATEAAPESPDRLLWRAAGAFFLIFGFGHLAVGALRLGAWSYAATAAAGCAVWLALAFYLTPNHEQLFNLEKLGLVSSAYYQRAAASLVGAAEKKLPATFAFDLSAAEGMPPEGEAFRENTR